MTRLLTLGRLELRDDGGGVVAARRKELLLLAYLARQAEGAGVRPPASRAALADLFWGDRDEARARHSLRQTLVRLRQWTNGAVVVDGEAVTLAPGTVSLDATELEADARAGRLAAAVERWGGEFLEGFEDAGGEAYRAWLEAERERIRRAAAWALDRLSSEAAAEARWADAAAWSERWAALRPYDPAALRRLAESLRALGRPAEALARLDAFAGRLRADLGSEPPAELDALARSLRTAAAAAGARPSPPTLGSAAVFTPDLAGRGDAMRTLAAAWHAVRDGATVAVAVEGDVGSGKTRLGDEFLRWLHSTAGPAHRRPALVLRARGREAGGGGAAGGGAPPYGVARALAAGLAEAPGLLGAPPWALAELAARLHPALRERLPAAAALPEPRGDEGTLHQALARVVADVAAEQPVCLVVDDFTWADEESRQLLYALLAARPPRLLLVAALRAEAGPDALAARSRLRGAAPELRRVSLPPLSVADLETMLDSMLALDPAERRTLAARLHTETAGNPFYAVETVRALVDAGYLTADAGGVWRLRGARRLPMPSTVREAVLLRLQGLSPTARAVADAAAVLAERTGTVAPAALARTTGLTTDELGAALDELALRRVLREVRLPTPADTGGGAGTPATALYEFTHEMLARVAAAAMSAPRRDLLRARAAGDAPGGDVTTAPPDLAARSPATTSARATRLWAAGAAAALLVALVGAAAATMGGRGGGDSAAGSPAADAPRTVAVAEVRGLAGSDSAGTFAAVALTDMLSTGLARVRGLHVVSGPRMLEIAAQLRGGGDSAAGATHVARSARADELVDGALHRSSDGALRLELRRVELASGATRGTYVVHARDAFELADRATSELAAGLGRQPPPTGLADVTTRSLAAYRLYARGLRAYYEPDVKRAASLFAAALAEDSTFAMAQYYAWKVAAHATPAAELVPMLARAARLAEARGTERERLRIRLELADAVNDPARLTLADSLATRYPADPEAHGSLGLMLLMDGQFLAAVPHFRRAIVLDSVGLHGPAPRCVACDAYENMVQAYTFADSLAAAERVARELLSARPRWATSWSVLAAVLAHQKRTPEALRAMETATSLDPAVAHAWRRADPQFRVRRERAAARGK